MPHDRFFTPQPLIQNQTIILEEEEAYHLVRIMRVEAGETVELINGQGQLAHANVTTIEKRSATLHITKLRQQPPPTHDLILAQALVRSNRLDTIVEKATELGITELWLFPGQRSEKEDLTPNQHQRVHSLTIAALKQCGRLYLPQVHIKPPLDKWSSLPCQSFYGDVDTAAPTFYHAWQQTHPSNALFVIGPEAGFTPHEERILKRLGATGVRLHNNILRTDTAAITAVSLMAHWQL